MRLTLSSAPAFAAATALLAVLAKAQAPSGAEAPPNPSDLLGNIVVVAGAGRPLPKIALVPSLSPDIEDVTVRSVVRRDLDLSGEFELLADSAAPEGLYGEGTPIDIKAWSSKGVEALVRVSGKKLDNDHAELGVAAYFVNRGPQPVYKKRFRVPTAALREESHRAADLVIGALTGQNGGFASHMAFSSSVGGLRRVLTMDADGHDAKPVSPSDRTAIAPAFGANGVLYYAIAPANDEYHIETSQGVKVAIPYQGSVYGLGFSRDHTQVAISLGSGDTVHVYAGPDFASLRLASEMGMALHPTFTPSGKLAFSGEGRYGQRIYVDGKPITPEGLNASSPCSATTPTERAWCSPWAWARIPISCPPGSEAVPCSA